MRKGFTRKPQRDAPEALGAQIEGDELVHVNGHAYDKLTVLDRHGKRRVAWFKTDADELLKERAMHPKGAPPQGCRSWPRDIIPACDNLCGM